MLNRQFLGLNKFSDHDAGQRLKYGFEKWNKKEYSYEGSFLKNRFHGFGTLKKQNSWTYEGNFYSNFKEGYAVLSLANHSYFEGLFIQNQPFGPGVFTYSNGCQDVGFWVGKKLVRLSRPVDFIVPRLAPNLSAKMKLMLLQRLIPLPENNFDSIIEIFEQMGYRKDLLFHLAANNVFDSRSFFCNSLSFEKDYFTLNESKKDISTSLKNSEDIKIYICKSKDEFAEEKRNSNTNINHKLCNDNFEEKFSENDLCNDYDFVTSEELQVGILNSHYKKLKEIDAMSDNSTEEYFEINDDYEKEDEINLKVENNKHIPPQMIFWNKGQLFTEMLKLIFRYRASEKNLSFKIVELMMGIRTAFRNTGEKEKVCLHFLKLCSSGPPEAVKNLLCNFEISEELMDSRGNNGLIFAVASDQREIIDILLDYGVDVNSFNDENLTPLNLCLLRRLAQSNGIHSWETAFLPPLLRETLEKYQKFINFPIENSNQSLDKIMGDGMSILNVNENNTFFINKSLSKEEREKKKLSSVLDTITDIQSQITLLNFGHSFDDVIEERDSSSESTSVGCNNQESNIYIKQKNTQKLNKKEEFEKSISKSSNDKYLFQFFSKDYLEEKNQEKNEFERNKINKKTSMKFENEDINSNLIKKLAEIDKTIEKLLERGADPNISEIPRPSIHLAIFTKNLNLVKLFLRYGANPNSQLHYNEGLLTPLHVLVLMKPSPENMGICELLLSYGADPEKETAPNFLIWKGEKNFMDEFHGRTPLQLLCMRPDLEQEDPNGYITKIALLLAKVSDKRHFFNGHLFLTISMLTGNIKLLKKLLQSWYIDPNEKLGKGLGTALQVLLSTNAQQKLNYDNIAIMRDLLLPPGSGTSPKFNTPSNLRNLTTQSGGRPIEKRKELYLTNLLKKKVKTSKLNNELNIKSKNNSGRNYSKDYTNILHPLNVSKISSKNETQVAYLLKQYVNVVDKNTTLKPKNLKKNREKKIASAFEKNLNEDNVNFPHENILLEHKKNNTVDENYKYNISNKKIKLQKSADKAHSKISNVKLENIFKKFDEKVYKQTKLQALDVSTKIKDNLKSKKLIKKENFFQKKRSQNTLSKSEEIPEIELKQFFKKKIFEKSSEKTLTKQIVQKKKLSNYKAKQMLPKALKNSLLNLFGNYLNIDINQFFLPYIVLRDGNLYYRFKTQPGVEKEQYSLV